MKTQSGSRYNYTISSTSEGRTSTHCLGGWVGPTAGLDGYGRIYIVVNITVNLRTALGCTISPTQILTLHLTF
jgi:hypothetical protein